MGIQIKCYATLACRQPTGGDAFPIRPGETLAEVLTRLGLSPDEVRVVFVNGEVAPRETVLHDGDRVGVFPAVGGG